MKHLPNLLSGLRIVLALGLLFVQPLGALFYLLYLLCGLSDVLDGWIARRLHAETVLGGRLDSVADFLMCLILLWRLIPVIRPGGALLFWIAVIAVLRLAAAMAARLRFGHWGFLHTLGNKLTGGLLFLYPLALGFTASKGILYGLCAVAAVTAAEELLIELTAKEWDADRKTILLPPKGHNAIHRK